MTQLKILDIVTGPSFDDLASSLHMDFPINFFVVENPDETAWQIEVTIILIAAKTQARMAWIFKGTYEDPSLGATVIVDGMISADPPHLGKLTLTYP